MTQDGVAFTVNLKRAFLKIGTKGARVAGQRAGERAAPQSRVVSTTQKRELAREATRGASAGLTLGPSATANASAQIGANAKSRFETTHTGVVSERVSHLNAHSANTWEIADTAPGENLRGLMVGHDTLCEISVDRGGYSVEGRLYCYPMDLSIDEVAFQSKGLSVLRKLSHTKNKLMAIFVSKVLGVDKSTDQIVLAKDELKEAPDEQEEGDESEGSQDIS